MKQVVITCTLLFAVIFSGTAQAVTGIAGKWKDASNADKVIDIYKHTDSKFYGKGSNGFIVLKQLAWDDKEKLYRGILVNPDNKEEFTIAITQVDKSFSFTVKKFIFRKTFKFVRVE
jgi:hypothetical protein